MSDRAAAPIDARGLRCPWPVLRLAKAMRGASGAAIRADDPQAADEIAALAAAQGWTLTVAGDCFTVAVRP